MNLKIFYIKDKGDLQNIAEERSDILLDDRDETLCNYLIDESSKVAQFLEGAFRRGQLSL